MLGYNSFGFQYENCTFLSIASALAPLLWPHTNEPHHFHFFLLLLFFANCVGVRVVKSCEKEGEVCSQLTDKKNAWA